ncbi:class I SAM-dependent methyltransferase [Pseudofrankia sp. DC12]|uniref:class I SAM-dependent methyltransferase n=1 Tax=Pseudofrankia sp. DC12 TaxID=683315 RepID=UPI0012F9575A|nr:class I SAM-dependent methyltransferase [Pseudofrankia sp. DC12]
MAVLDRHVEPFTEKTLQGYALRKPRRYAGDFRIIDMIYQVQASPDEHLARWDEYFHAQPAPIAVRNRKSYFHRILDRHNQRPFRVLKLGIGPGRGMYEWLARNPTARVELECVDIDADSVAYAAALNAEFSDRITFHTANVFRFVPAPSSPYELIWAAGQFDYFDDRAFVRIAQRFFEYVRPGGELVIGNFSTDNPTRPYMEIFGDWYLNHRTPDDLLRLATEIAGDGVTARDDQEETAVNLFLHLAR